MIPELILLIIPTCTRRGEALYSRADVELTENQGSLGVQSFYLFLSLE